MKRITAIILLTLSCSLAAMEDEAIDEDKINARRFTEYVRYVVWPSVDDIERTQVSTTSVPDDVNAMWNVLNSRIRSQYIPSRHDYNKYVITCTNLYDSGDHLLLRYSTSNNVNIQIQEGNVFNVLIYEHRLESVPLSNIAQFVKDVSARYLCYPGDPEIAAEEVEIFESSVDIGASRCGILSYGPRVIPPKYWYSYFLWWSDGKRVMFSMQRHETTDIAGRSSPVERPKPRRFSESIDSPDQLRADRDNRK